MTVVAFMVGTRETREMEKIRGPSGAMIMSADNSSNLLILKNHML